MTAYGIDAERLHILTYHELRNLNAVIYRNCAGRRSRYSTRTQARAPPIQQTYMCAEAVLYLATAHFKKDVRFNVKERARASPV